MRTCMEFVADASRASLLASKNLKAATDKILDFEIKCMEWNIAGISQLWNEHKDWLQTRGDTPIAMEIKLMCTFSAQWRRASLHRLGNAKCSTLDILFPCRNPPKTISDHYEKNIKSLKSCISLPVLTFVNMKLPLIVCWAMLKTIQFRIFTQKHRGKLQ